MIVLQRQGVEVDYCPKCRGVWLDWGELDKIVDRSVGRGDPWVWEATPSPLDGVIAGRGGTPKAGTDTV